MRDVEPDHIVMPTDVRRLQPSDIVVVHIPEDYTAWGAWARPSRVLVDHPDPVGAVEYEADRPGAPMVAAIAADSIEHDWVLTARRHEALHDLLADCPPGDRAVWEQAAAAVRGGGIAVIQHEAIGFKADYGVDGRRARWRATSVRPVASPRPLDGGKALGLRAPLGIDSYMEPVAVIAAPDPGRKCPP